MKRKGNVLWGLVFIAVGIIWAGNALGIIDVDMFFDGWWTLFIIIPTTIGLVIREDISANAILLAIGVILLLYAQNILTFELLIELYIPAVLIAIGFALIFHEKFHNKDKCEVKNKEVKEVREIKETDPNNLEK